MSSIDKLFAILALHEEKFNRSFSLIPSENTISPLSRAAFLSDALARYFFDEKEVFGRWSFEGGSIAGHIQTQVVVPLLRRLGRASFVNVHGISGLTAMTVALAAFGGESGSRVVSVDPANGGHPDTRYVAEKLGYEVLALPFATWDALDLEGLAALVEFHRPSLVYVDHATALVPLDLASLVSTVRSASPTSVHVHIDTSHVNGLVWGGVLPNPLDCGADSYGGSTHKTFPGPHKAVLFTNNAEAAERLTMTAVNMISHHHLSSVIALGVALVEFDECGGRRYARLVCENARMFARALADRGIFVEGHPPSFTSTHQVWVRPDEGTDVYRLAPELFRAGLVVNPFNPLPSIGGIGIRMGMNEPTRLGLEDDGIRELARAFADVAHGEKPEAVAPRIAALRAGAAPAFCFTGERLLEVLAPFFATIEDDRRVFCRTDLSGVRWR